MAIIGLKELNSLEVDNNSLASFYEDPNIRRQHVGLLNLSYLNLNNNKLRAIPSILRHLTALK